LSIRRDVLRNSIGDIKNKNKQRFKVSLQEYS